MSSTIVQKVGSSVHKDSDSQSPSTRAVTDGSAHKQSDLNRIGHYLLKHKDILADKSDFSLQQIYEFLQKESIDENIDTILKK